MVSQPIQRRTLGLVVCLLGLASVLVWAGSALDFTRVRTRTTRSLRADDSELAHEHGEHGVFPTVACTAQNSAAISAHLASEDGSGGVHIAPAAGNSPHDLFYPSWTPLIAPLSPSSNSAFAGFAHTLRGPPSQS
jgi:hypothetical protein